MCQTPLLSETEGPCSAHGQVPASARSSQLWDRGKSWAPKPFCETNSFRRHSASSSLSPSQELWYWAMNKLLWHFSYSKVFGSSSLFLQVPRYPARASSNCCPSLSEKGKCAAAYLNETCRNSIPLRPLLPCQIWQNLASFKQLWRGKWTSKHTIWLHKIIPTGITFAWLKSEEDLDFLLPKMGKYFVPPLQLLQSSNSSVAPCRYCSFISWPRVQEHISFLVEDHPNSAYKCVMKWRGPQTFFLELFHIVWYNCKFAGLMWESASTLQASDYEISLGMRISWI